MSRLTDILKTNKGKLPDDILLAYTQGRLSSEEQREIELWLADGGFEDDAVEGLKELNEEEAKDTVARLNRDLDRELKKKPKRRSKAIQKTPWGIAAILLILLLCLAAYVVLYLAAKN